ncbi:MAG TPA: ABC transporter ATP-binding protein [Syntrophobacteraceae bacterium]|nr:ABC transporter ATP-binding protein [Syntrophobacteraceae bacterium]
MIKVENLSKSYPTSRGGWRRVLHDINMEVRKGEKVGIIGLNGSGKSTLIRLIGGAEIPSRGTVTRTMSVSWPLAFMGAFQPSLTGLDNLRFICRVYGVDYKKSIPFVEEFSELGRYLREPVKKYSSGMIARLAFALSMAQEFDCFLIDEIIAVGDARFHGRCIVELFGKRSDRAMIMVSHNDHFLRSHCDRICVLVAGRMYDFDNPEDAFAFHAESVNSAETRLL